MATTSAPLDFAGGTLAPPFAQQDFARKASHAVHPAHVTFVLSSVLCVGIAWLATVVAHLMPSARYTTSAVSYHASLHFSDFFTLGPHMLPYALFFVLNIRRALFVLLCTCPPEHKAEHSEDIMWLLPDPDTVTSDAQISAINRSAINMYVVGAEITCLSILLIVTGLWHIDQHARAFCY